MLFRRLLAEATASPGRVLDATRMVSVGITAALGQFLIDDPLGLLGASQHATAIGLGIAATTLLGSIACAIATIATRGAAWTRWVFGLIALAGLTVFVPGLATDVGVAGAVVGWQLVVLARLVATHEVGGKLRS